MATTRQQPRPDKSTAPSRRPTARSPAGDAPKPVPRTSSLRSSSPSAATRPPAKKPPSPSPTSHHRRTLSSSSQTTPCTAIPIKSPNISPSPKPLPARTAAGSRSPITKARIPAGTAPTIRKRREGSPTTIETDAAAPIPPVQDQPLDEIVDSSLPLQHPDEPPIASDPPPPEQQHVDDDAGAGKADDDIEVSHCHDTQQVLPEEEKQVISELAPVEEKVVAPAAAAETVAPTPPPAVKGTKKEAQRSNDVIEEFKSKAMEKRKNKVLALVGAFETVMSLHEPAGGQQSQQQHDKKAAAPKPPEEKVAVPPPPEEGATPPPPEEEGATPPPPEEEAVAAEPSIV